MKHLLGAVLASVLLCGCANSHSRLEVRKADGTVIRQYNSKDVDVEASQAADGAWQFGLRSNASGPISAKGEAAANIVDASAGIAGSLFTAGVQFAESQFSPQLLDLRAKNQQLTAENAELRRALAEAQKAKAENE